VCVGTGRQAGGLASDAPPQHHNNQSGRSCISIWIVKVKECVFVSSDVCVPKKCKSLPSSGEEALVDVRSLLRSEDKADTQASSSTATRHI